MRPRSFVVAPLTPPALRDRRLAPSRREPPDVVKTTSYIAVIAVILRDDGGAGDAFVVGSFETRVYGFTP
jgi:hypothetical protein